MSSDLATVAADLADYLVANCPTGWIIADSEKLRKTTKTALSYEQGDLTIDVIGQDLPTGFIGVEFLLTLSTPETDATKGLPRVTEAMGHLFAALDMTDQIRHANAERVRLDTGESAYRLPIAVLAAYNIPTSQPEEA